MSLLSVVKDVCTLVGVTVPTAVIPGIDGNRTMQEMRALANEVARRIAYDTREWTRLKVQATIEGDGVTTAWDLPVNFKRMLLTSNVWSNIQAQTPLLFVPDTDAWLQRRMMNSSDARGEWTIYGGQIHIFPPLPGPPPEGGAGAKAAYPYLDKNCIKLDGGGYSDAFMTDEDQFVLDERLLKLGMIWQWKAHKGSPYAEDMGSFSDALVISMGADSPAPIIVGRGGIYTSGAPLWP